MKSFALAAIILGMVLLLPLFIVLIKLFGEWLWEAFRKTDYLLDSGSLYWAAVLAGVVFLILGVVLLCNYYDLQEQEAQSIQQTQQEQP